MQRRLEENKNNACKNLQLIKNKIKKCQGQTSNLVTTLPNKMINLDIDLKYLLHGLNSELYMPAYISTSSYKL